MKKSKPSLYKDRVFSVPAGNCKRATAVQTTLRINENQIREKDTKFENLPYPRVDYQNASLIQLH